MPSGWRPRPACRPRPAGARGSAARHDQVERAQVDPELVLEVLDRRVGDLARRGEAADEVDHAAQRGALAGGDVDHLAHRAGSNRSACSNSRPSRSGRRSSSRSAIHGTTARQPGSRKTCTTATPEAAGPARDHRPVPISATPLRSLSSSAPVPIIQRHMAVRDLMAGTIGQVTVLVREAELRAQARRLGASPPRARRPHRARCRRWCGTGCPTPRRRAGSGEPVHVSGVYSVHPRFGSSARGRGRCARCAPGEVAVAELVDGPVRARATRWRPTCARLVATVREPHLRFLLEGLLGERSRTWPAYRDAPAAKHNHHAYQHGLLEHSLERGPDRVARRGHLPRHRPRHRRDRRAAARHRQARRLRRGRNGPSR